MLPNATEILTFQLDEDVCILLQRFQNVAEADQEGEQIYLCFACVYHSCFILDSKVPLFVHAHPSVSLNSEMIVIFSDHFDEINVAQLEIWQSSIFENKV